jgi:hypothetical protein
MMHDTCFAEHESPQVKCAQLLSILELEKSVVRVIVQIDAKIVLCYKLQVKKLFFEPKSVWILNI